MRYCAWVFLLCGCSTLPTAYSTPPSSTARANPYNAEVEYELLTPVTAEACASTEELKQLHPYRSQDPRAIGHGVLFEQAKYEAIEKVKADGLLELRAKVLAKGDGECVTVTGRAYRLQSVRATGGHEGGDRSAWDPSGETSRRPPAAATDDRQ